MKRLLKSFIFIFLCLLFSTFNVYAEEGINIKSIRVVGQSGTITLGNLDYSNNTINSNIVFNNINDFVTYEIEIENNTYKKYLLESVSINNNDYLTVSTEDINTNINPKSISTIQVKIKYENELINQEEISLNNLNLILNYSYGEITNPNTGFSIDNLVLVIALISLFGVGYVLFKIKKKEVILLFLLLPMFVIAKEYKPITISFSNVKVKGRFINYRIEIDDGSGQHILKGKQYGSTVDNLSTPSKRGYNFTGWKDQDGNEITNESTVSKDMIITAQYEPIIYNITYDLDGGLLREDNPSTVSVESEFTLNNPNKEGYTFVGWTSDDGRSVYQTIRKYSNRTVVGDMHFKAVYSEANLANYTVIHRKEIAREEYVEIEREVLSGPIGSTVNVMPKNYEGLTLDGLSRDPFVTITEDGLATVTITYYTVSCRFSVDSFDGYYSDNSTTNGEKSYGTEIVLNAEERPGYTLWWSDGVTGSHRTFKITKDINLSARYIPNGNVQYKVIHMLQKLPGGRYEEDEGFDDYFIHEVSYFNGVPGEEVEPETNIYEGFTAPQTERIRLVEGEANTVVYYYTRNKYLLTIEGSENVETSTPSGEYYYGTYISLRAKRIDGYSFVQWSDGNTDNPRSFNINGDMTIKAIYGDPCAMFDSGGTVNVKMKRLAGNTSPTINTENMNIQQIVRAESLPDGFTPLNDNIVSYYSSEYPIYMWYDNNIIYYYSVASNILLNTNSSNMFRCMKQLGSIDGIGNWDASRATSLFYMFYATGYNATTFNLGDLSNWNTLKVTDMRGVFYNSGHNSTTWNIGNLSNWDTSKVTNMAQMFSLAGYSATTFNIGDLSNWDTSSVTDMSQMFQSAGYSARTINIGSLYNWDISNVTDLSSMFYGFGYAATSWNIGSLANWNTAKVTNMSHMFYMAGCYSRTWNMGNLANWNTSKVTDMSYMFQSTGNGYWYIGDISNWNTSNVTNMKYMFYNAGVNSSVWGIGDISNWNTSKVTDMSSMFRLAGENSTTWNSIGNLKVYANNIESMFTRCPKAKATLSIYNNPTNYTTAFSGAATASGAGITVNYAENVTNIDNIIATKSDNSNVSKGELLPDKK